MKSGITWFYRIALLCFAVSRYLAVTPFVPE